jgi:hypothetical protein
MCGIGNYFHCFSIFVEIKKLNHSFFFDVEFHKQLTFKNSLLLHSIFDVVHSFFTLILIRLFFFGCRILVEIKVKIQKIVNFIALFFVQFYCHRNFYFFAK